MQVDWRCFTATGPTGTCLDSMPAAAYKVERPTDDNLLASLSTSEVLKDMNDSREDEEVTPTLPVRPTPRRGFPIVQYGFTIPKPSYHKHLADNPSGFDQASEADEAFNSETPGEAGSDTGSAAARHAHRSRKLRLWAFFVFVLLIYGLMRTAQYMR